jgi:hypothetical protein
LVPANSFAESAPEPNRETNKNDVVWFALNEDRPFAFAGIWTAFNGYRGTKSKPIPGPHNVYGLPHPRAECGGCSDPSQGDTGVPAN